ncbi:hypothetical protein [Leeia oryzae]|uniref:hypothetical protein n=1 Tax=Leeia oryzae TaxID=356662 RepID=UPI00037FDF96|nr:hypothetical protein [Leeia oryzae]
MSIRCKHLRGAVLLLMCMVWLVLLAGWWLMHWQQSATVMHGIRQQQSHLQHIKQSLLDAMASDDAGSVLGSAFAPDILLNGSSHGIGDYGVCLDALAADGLPYAKYGINATAYAGLRCIGRLPVRDVRIPTTSGMWQGDPTGESIWYAVSPNLLDVASDPASPGGACLDFLNADILSQPAGTAICQHGALPYPWLVIRDTNGKVISDQVAMILIAPGRADAPRTSQWTQLSRSILSQYLDNITIGAGHAFMVSGHYDNAALTLSLIQAPISRDDASSALYESPYRFNDQLVWITRQELVDRLVWHVVQVLAHDLNYPYPPFRPPLDTLHPSAPGKINRWTRLERHWGYTFRYQKLTDDHVQVQLSGCQSEFDLVYVAAGSQPYTQIRRTGPC